MEIRRLPQSNTLDETRVVIGRAGPQFRHSLQLRIAREKAKLTLERSNGTIAHVIRFLNSWKLYGLLIRIEIERGLRKVPRLLALEIYCMLLGIWNVLSIDMERLPPSVKHQARQSRAGLGL